MSYYKSTGQKKLREALKSYKGSSGDLLHLIARHLDLEEPDASVIVEATANLLDNEFNERA